jgi:hypothetical protein
MSRFFLHLHEGGLVTVDEEGYDFDNEEEAREAALRSARELMCAELQGGTLCLGWHIEVRNAESGSSFVVHFRDAVTITGG